MDTLATPGDEAVPTKPGSPAAVDKRHEFYGTLLGGAVGGSYQLIHLVE